MIKAFKDFLLDDSGAVTVDSVVVMGGTVWMAAAVVGDIGMATVSVGDKINERLEYASIIAQIVGEYGPGDSSELPPCDSNNPGNDKCVGNAGEEPTDGDWGETGSQGQGD